MEAGNKQKFDEAWRDLKEAFVRRLARRYYGLEIDPFTIRSYKVESNRLTSVLDEIRRRNIFETTMFRAGRRIRIILRRNAFREPRE